MGEFGGRVAVVTGGGGGIGSAVARRLGRQGATVVALDNGAGVEGEPLAEPTAAETVKAIEADGGRGLASTASVTDRDAIQDLFQRIVRDFGSLDVVVNTAGILRFRTLPDSTENDWTAVLDVHLNGYLNILHAALPIMVEAGYGRVVGVTSGAGLARTSGDGLAYGCAKRAVAALTWQLGPLLPPGIALNVLSPIAATRMVRQTILAADEAAAVTSTDRDPRSLDLSAMPQAEDMAPAAAYLASEQVGWCRGRVVFSAGPEISVIVPPALLEAVRTEDVPDFGAALGTLVPVVLGPAEARQRTGGGANPRFGEVFGVVQAPAEAPSAGSQPEGHPARPNCLIVSDDAPMAAAVARAVSGWGLTPFGIGAWQPFASGATAAAPGFAGAADGLAGAVRTAGPLDAVVVILAPPAPPPSAASPSGELPAWAQVLHQHATTARHVLDQAAWLRAASRHGMAGGRPIRVVHLTRGSSPAARTAAQAVAQLARSANETARPAHLDAFSVSVESEQPSDVAAVGQLVARLIGADDTLALRGGELAAGRGWIGLRSHPGPGVTVSFGDPTGPVPGWVDQLLAEEGFAPGL